MGCHIIAHLSSQSCPGDADQTGCNSQEHHSVADLDAVGTADVAQEAITAFGGISCHTKVQVGLRTLCSTFLGDAVPFVLAWVENRQERRAVTKDSSARADQGMGGGSILHSA